MKTDGFVYVPTVNGIGFGHYATLEAAKRAFKGVWFTEYLDVFRYWGGDDGTVITEYPLYA